jgi:hypothetical protein
MSVLFLWQTLSVRITKEAEQRFIDAWEESFGERLPPEHAKIEMLRPFHFFTLLGYLQTKRQGREEKGKPTKS